LSIIIRYFKNKGYHAVYEIVDRTRIEHHEGIDAYAIIGQKIIGFQVKRPNENNSYRLEPIQYQKVQQRKWVYYAFPENIPRVEMKNVLHRTKFSKGYFPYADNINFENIIDGVRWGDVAKGLEQCPIGQILNAENIRDFHGSLQEIIEEQLSIISLNMEDKQLHLFIGDQRYIDKRIFRQSEKKIQKKEDQFKCPRCGWPDNN